MSDETLSTFQGRMPVTNRSSHVFYRRFYKVERSGERAENSFEGFVIKTSYFCSLDLSVCTSGKPNPQSLSRRNNKF